MAPDEPPVGQVSPGARWATGTTEPPASKETTAELEATPAPTGTPAELEATPAPTGTPTDQPTVFAAQPAPVRDLPAGVDPGDLSSAPPGSARRGKLRRRLRYLRHVRELLLRDLGGFTYEVHRTAGGTAQAGHRRLAEAKAHRIAALDAEVGAIEARLGEPHVETVLREEGIGGTCPECGELHASDARFCSRCGTPLDAKARAQREASIAAAAQPTPEPQPASVLWAGGPRPASGREEKEQPSAVTNRWLLGQDQPTTADPAAAPDERPAADEAAAMDDPGAAGGSGEAPDEAAATSEPAVAEETGAPTPAPGHEAATGAPTTGPGDDTATTEAGDDTATGAPTPGAGDETTTAPGDAGATDDDPAAATGGDAEEPTRRFEPGPNGRRDEDVPSPLTPRDELTSRRGDQAP